MRNEVVCIGGPADGKRFQVDREQYRLVTYDLPTPNYRQEEIPVIIKEFVYNIRTLAGSYKTYRVAVPSEMTGDEIVERLLTGYKNAE